MDATDFVLLNINGEDHKVPASFEGDNLLESLKAAGFDIPHFCYHKDLGSVGTCGLCTIQAQRHDEDKPSLVKACETLSESFMKIVTDNSFVRKHRLESLSTLTSRQSKLRSIPSHAPGSELDTFTSQCTEWSKDSTHAITIDRSMCVSCQRCVKMCRDVQEVGVLRVSSEGTVAVTPEGLGLGDSGCISCGGCTSVCPTGAIKETSFIEKIEEWISDPLIITVAQVAPSIRVLFGELFGEEPADYTKHVIAGLRTLGFDYCFDTEFGADLCIMEEAFEFVQRLTGRSEKPLPMTTSCCPAFVTFAEKNSPQLLPHISTVRSPHILVGSIIKSYWSFLKGFDPSVIRVVSIMPCVTKGSEAARPELVVEGFPAVDVVLTAREFGTFLKSKLRNPLVEINQIINQNPPSFSSFDSNLGESTASAQSFARTGGVMTSALKVVYHWLRGEELPEIKFSPVPHMKGVKEAVVDFGVEGIGEVKVAVVNGISGVQKITQDLSSCPFAFIEVMSCIGGCIVGMGGPKFENREEATAKRTRVVDDLAKQKGRVQLRSDQNVEVQTLYRDYLETPGSEMAEKLLHTSYRARKLLKAPVPPIDRTTLLSTEQHTVKEKEKGKVQVLFLFSTTTGTAEELCLNCANEVWTNGFSVDIKNTKDLEPSALLSFTNSITLVLFISTYGVGDIPESAKDLWNYLSRPSMKPNELCNVNYCIFSLGSSTFPNFCKAGFDFDSLLSSLGAQRILDICSVDTMQRNSVLTKLDTFTESLLSILPEFVGFPHLRAKEEYPKATFRVAKSIGKMARIPPPVPFTSRLLVKSVSLLTPSDYIRPIYKVVFQSRSSISYNIGDSLSLYPHNKPNLVEQLLTFLKLNPEELISVLPIQGTKIPSKFAPRITFRHLISQYFALEECPSRRFCHSLSFFVSDDREKQKLLHFGSKEGGDDLSKWCKLGGSVVDLITSFSTLNIPLDLLLSIIPLQKPRLYSIASAPRVFTDEIHMIMVNVDYILDDGTKRQGVTSSYVTRLFKEFQLSSQFTHYSSLGINPGTLKFPKDLDSFVMVFALGTGIAPFLAHFQERNRLISQGRRLGNLVLYLGCRMEQMDFICKQEILNYAKTGVITHLKTSFSHDQEQFVTPLDRLKEDRQTPIEYMQNEKFCFYYCGLAGIVDKIELILTEIAMENGLDPEHVFSRAKKELRWNVEAI
ncbi:hypothetical protein P9112_000945 [Eukaryota sp. TZLM1-RC]